LSAEKSLENGAFVDAANKNGSPFAETDIPQSAVHMERVKVVFEF